MPFFPSTAPFELQNTPCRCRAECTPLAGLYNDLEFTVSLLVTSPPCQASMHSLLPCLTPLVKHIVSSPLSSPPHHHSHHILSLWRSIFVHLISPLPLLPFSTHFYLLPSLVRIFTITSPFSLLFIYIYFLPASQFSPSSFLLRLAPLYSCPGYGELRGTVACNMLRLLL